MFRSWSSSGKHYLNKQLFKPFLNKTNNNVSKQIKIKRNKHYRKQTKSNENKQTVM